MFIRLLRIMSLALSLSMIFLVSTAQQILKPPITREEWTREYKSFRLAGNLYYVGSYDLACYLITTPQGHILINTGMPESASMIQKNVESLGFKFSDIKILLATHAHFDHVGAMAEIKELTGAKLFINENDAPVMADGGNSDFVFGGKGSTFKPVKADSLLHGNDTVRLGGMQIIVLHHPGHTKGASSFLFDIKDGKKTYRTLIANMPTVLEETKLSGMPTYPDVAKDYAYTLSELKKLQFDIWFSSHASQFSLHTKRKPGDPYNPSVFIDRKGYDAEVDDLEKAYLKRLNEKLNPSNITIARDSFGVPHIFAPTDPEAAYGLAWAHAEDDFEDIQLLMLTGKARLGTALGKKGAEADYVINLLRCRQTVEEQWSTLSPDVVALIKGYVAGINAYAKAYPKQIKYKKAFPFNEKEYLTAVMFSLSIFCGVGNTLPQILAGRVPFNPRFSPLGSNALAVHPSKTNTGEAFLAINAHQPLEGPTAFYEAHIQSDQGWNMLGGVFPGGCVIFHGTNENLGWAHTVNYMDKIDVFQLEINPDNRNQYRFDGQWYNLEEKKAKLKVKGVPVTIGKKVYWSKYGATVKTKNGVFAMRLPANMDIKALEEWYRMNKARNFTEFYKAISMTSLPMFNIMYADRYDTIFYVSNGKMPYRNPDPAYNWRSTVPGNTSKTLWTTYKPITELPQYINPASGYLYNTNHSPFLATAPASNLDPNKYDKNDGYELYHNNRSQRIADLTQGISKFDFTTFKKIKFDYHLPQQLRYPYDIDTLMVIRADDYPQLKDIITTYQQWDRNAITSSRGAAVFLLIYHYIADRLKGEASRQITRQESVDAYQHVYDYMMKYFGRTDLTLGDIQKLVRGNDARPASGIPDVLAATYSGPYKNGLWKVVSGDAYICLVRYPKNGLPIIESVNTFGASMHPDSPHYKDQMALFQQQQTKHMTLDKEEILRKAERIYHPLKQ